jgi:hypothetical protein
MYKLNVWASRNEVEKKFRKYFKIKFRDFHFAEFSELTGFVMMDTIKFSEFLEVKHGEKEVGGMSYLDFVEKQYGAEALNFIREII